MLSWSAKRHAEAMQCGSNLTSISLAAILYFNDNDQRFPHSILEMSNEIAAPKILICPADAARQASKHWNKLGSTPWMLLTTNDFTYQWVAASQVQTISTQVLIRCPIHEFTARANGTVLDKNENIAPNEKLLKR